MTDDELKAVLPPKLAKAFTKYDFMLRAFRAMIDNNVHLSKEILESALDDIYDKNEQLAVLEALDEMQQEVAKMSERVAQNEQLVAVMFDALEEEEMEEHITPEQEAEFERFAQGGVTIHLSKEQVDHLLNMEEDACYTQATILEKLNIKAALGLLTETEKVGIEVGKARHAGTHAIGKYLRDEIKRQYPMLEGNVDLDNVTKH
jgi:Rps23 Pro-64 3,4-dihydroxylase Tpa1-like proline 4-hydroxylase